MNFKSIVKVATIFLVATSFSACTRIATGEVGLRVDASKQVQGAELQPGSMNQTLFGSVLTFPVRDISLNLENKRPVTSDTTALQDLDLTVVYGINPTSVSDLYTKKARSFHGLDEDGDTVLMYNYMQTLVNNATYKAVRKYPALTVADKRAEIEADILTIVSEQLKAEGLDGALTVSVVKVRNIEPNQEILNAATAAVKAQSELARKNTEVQIAQKEAERMEALAKNGKESVAYMDAQARLLIAQGVKEGKIKAIVIPHDFKGIVQVHD